MCAVAGEFGTCPGVSGHAPWVSRAIEMMSHRGPDGTGYWCAPFKLCELAHARLSIIDLQTGDQPLVAHNGDAISFNGEIYNYVELRKELQEGWTFRTSSDTEVILAAYDKWGTDCLNKFRGIFAFLLYDQSQNCLFCARDQFGVKPLYYTWEKNCFRAASEAKALLIGNSCPEPDYHAIADYLHFQFLLEGRTLFKGIRELPAGHYLVVRENGLDLREYWKLRFDTNHRLDASTSKEMLRHLFSRSIDFNLRSDVPVGAYLSGGFDSSLVSLAATSRNGGSEFKAFHGRFAEGPEFDESSYAKCVAEAGGMKLFERTISASDFEKNIRSIVWHMDYPVAGPGVFPQFLVSEMASSHVKVVLGGQGADEMFGGYVRYLVAYFEQCLKGAIQGTAGEGHFLVTYESIIGSLSQLRGYGPMLADFWREGLFGDMDRRYYRLIDRGGDLSNEVAWGMLPNEDVEGRFLDLFRSGDSPEPCYFNRMTRFDFKTLLPALLHVEDRVSMAHGLESRVPFLDLDLVEFSASLPASTKFRDGYLKRHLYETFESVVPRKISERTNKMGFPVPLNRWGQDDLKEFLRGVFESQKCRERELFNTRAIIDGLDKAQPFNRKLWGLLSLELWFQQFIDSPGLSQ